MVKRDYYVILGVSPTESSAGIQQAFRRLAKKHHPDLGGPASTDTFQEIAQAYEILSDPEQRRAYDKNRSEREHLSQSGRPKRFGREPSYQPEPLVPKPMWNVYEPEPSGTPFDALSDLLFRNSSGIDIPGGERIGSFNIELTLTRMEAAVGVIAPIEVPVFRDCRLCHGRGEDWGFRCMSCAGKGLIEDHQTLSLRLPPGIKDGTVIQVPLTAVGMPNFYLRLHVLVCR